MVERVAGTNVITPPVSECSRVLIYFLSAPRIDLICNYSHQTNRSTDYFVHKKCFLGRRHLASKGHEASAHNVMTVENAPKSPVLIQRCDGPIAGIAVPLDGL